MGVLAGVGAFVVATVVEAIVIGLIAGFRPIEVSVWEGVAVGAIGIILVFNVVFAITVGKGQ